MDNLTKAGKIRHYGVSVERVEEAIKAIEYPNVKSVQIIFNMFRRRPAELFFSEAIRRKVGIIVRVPLASGLLSGKLSASSTFASDDHRNFNRYGQAFDRGETFSGVDYDTGLAAVDKLRKLVPRGATLPQMALRWILMFRAVSCVIPGVRNAVQMEDNARAAALKPLSRVQMSRAEKIYDAEIRQLVHHRW
jgi:aryl-alcohol dehydrogenase-like predicted oxidoreductase